MSKYYVVSGDILPDVLEQVQGAEMASIKDGNIVINVINS